MNIAGDISSDFTLEQQITAAHTRPSHYLGIMAITFASTAASLFFILAYAAGATAFGKVAPLLNLSTDQVRPAANHTDANFLDHFQRFTHLSQVIERAEITSLSL